jgi:hypothetical protein
VIGSASDSTFFLGGQTAATDIYNFNNNKQLNQYVRPLTTVISFLYTTPRIAATSTSMKWVSIGLRDWQVGAVLRYQSGQLLPNPSSLNNIVTQLGRGAGNFGLGGSNYWNLTGQNRLTVDPNCGCFDPQKVSVLNTGAWVDAPAGQWTTSAPYYNNFRWQRQPSEAFNFGRNFRFGADGRYNFFIRAEFQNIFNRLFLSTPSNANPNLPITTTLYNGVAINNAGFGSVGTLNGGAAQPRSGQIVGRFTF